jgi:hypothetical protein
MTMVSKFGQSRMRQAPPQRRGPLRIGAIDLSSFELILASHPPRWQDGWHFIQAAIDIRC